jgi:small conductance mechanosensitive channel
MEQTVMQVFTPLQKTIDTSIDFLVNYSFQVIGAILILVIGALAARWVSGIIMGICQRRNIDVTLAKFFASTTRIIVLTFAVIVALGKFGITIAPFIAAIGAAAFGITYAIQGPLSNYGAGLAIILGRSFLVGDTVTVAGVTGVVDEIKLAYTVLVDEDGVKITIPSRHIVGEVLHNSGPNKIVEAVVGISYSDNPERAAAVIRKALSTFADVATTPPAQVGIQAFADSSVYIGYRYWVTTAKYFQTLYAVNLAVFQALKEAGISIPFPQREVRILGEARK